MVELTVFTPTYNRAYILDKCYESLCRQTGRDFEWLIVDDGSTDQTGELVQRWITENKIRIRYFYQPNGGKCRAHNRGVENAVGNLFVCVDSDDHLTDDAVAVILKFWKSHSEESAAGIVAYRGKGPGRALTDTPFPELPSSTLGNLYRKYGFVGDTTLVFRTNILREHLFPEVDGEKFITEAYIYDQIDRRLPLLILPYVLTVCEYRDDGYTRNFLEVLRKNPKGWALYYNQKSYFETEFYQKYKLAGYYVCMSMLAGQHDFILRSKNRFLSFAAVPFGLLLCVKRLHQYKSLKK